MGHDGKGGCMKKIVLLLIAVLSNMHGIYASLHPNFGKKHFIVGYDHKNEIATPQPQPRKQKYTHQLCDKTIKDSSYLLDNECMLQPFFSTIHNLHSIITTVLKQAQKSICIAAFALTDNVIAEQLKTAHTAGIKIEVITDGQNMKEKYSKINNLVNAHIPVYCYHALTNPNAHQKSARDGLMHHKFIIVDDMILITGSANLTKAGQKGNIENIFVVRDPDSIQKYSAEFEYLKLYCTQKLSQ